MTRETHDSLWRDFPKTAGEFEARFATEEDCRAYWIEARWGGKPACARWSGGIEARTGLRMMPTFPRPLLSFRTAGFPRYGWKAGI